jgi:hypothetical protein
MSGIILFEKSRNESGVFQIISSGEPLPDLALCVPGSPFIPAGPIRGNSFPIGLRAGMTVRCSRIT